MITILTPSLNDNSLGRTYSLWMLARSCGIDVQVISAFGSQIWGPVSTTAFAAACDRRPDLLFRRSTQRQIAARSDLLIAVKPLPASLGIALQIRRRFRTPILLDIDDPDLETRLHRSSIAKAPWIIKNPALYRRVRTKTSVQALAQVSVSNPVLQSWYGGVVIPHARPLLPAGAQHLTTAPTVSYVGTVRPHKGLEILRAALTHHAKSGYTLNVTAPPPPDALPHENWIGPTSFEDGIRLVSQSDIVAVPSLNSSHAVGQFPAKLVDAMLTGRAIIASRVDPIPWAAQETGILVKPGDITELSTALGRLSDPALRTKLGASARSRAIASYTVPALEEAFRYVVERAIGWHATSVSCGYTQS